MEAIQRIIRNALDVGVPTYNVGDHAGCARVYCNAAIELLQSRGSRRFASRSWSKLEKAVAQTVGTPDWRTAKGETAAATANAWAMREALDELMAVLGRAGLADSDDSSDEDGGASSFGRQFLGRSDFSGGGGGFPGGMDGETMFNMFGGGMGGMGGGGRGGMPQGFNFG